MSQAGANSTSGSSGSSITTLDGDTGSATGTTVTLYADQAALNCGSSVSFTNSGSTSLLSVTDSDSNTIIGSASGNTSITASYNTIIGASNASGLTSGNSNQVVGHSSVNALTTGTFNVAMGNNVLDHLTTGSYNITLGYQAGNNYTSSESSNILISNAGVLSESNAIHIGTQGSGNQEQDTCYIAGIAGVSVSNLNYVTINTSTGQLGSTSAITQVLTITSVDSVESPYTVVSTDQFIAINSSAGTVTIKLPNTTTTGRVICVKDSTGNAATYNITITTVGGSVDIDGATSYVISNNYQSVNLLWDGSGYEVF